ncbi:MAG: bifunctional DNA-formamidopyrimidine glycosylase/DNA-(apurinic or apyrimidinic site) lyase [Bryobacterales bacterium]|nr:bifunctional DNA-formamidopyrimidine glycosylase/DNA-(apurinic or apyrimidinic site) lyase [Bryobacteraceae bacterium]MDW8354518.1 bifunctional DNA-formamidopyrimidine glycosylase/DNA-(apurinic or apyrimidinic site) lyase [Bryobacterales bacterium]
MPELPEVETIVRALAPRLTGQRIAGLRFLARRARRGRVPELRGRQIRAVRRYGKYILIDLDRGMLAVHLGMTGRLLWNGRPGPYTRAVLRLTGQDAVLFDDPRQFGGIRYGFAPPAGLGPDALEISESEFLDRLLGRKGRIKALLLNQRFLRGLGNIYTDESLFRARIHPRAPVGRLSRERARALYRAIRDVLSEAIAAGGSSVSDYITPEGAEGLFQFDHRVYGRAGQPCLACGTPIRRIVVAQRGTYYCPRCQLL